VPSTIVFSENPYLASGSKFSLTGIASIGGAFTGVAECVTTTAAPVLVGTKWEVATDLVMVSLTGSSTYLATQTQQATNAFGGFGCPPSTDSALGNSLKAVLCDGIINPNNFSGYIYTRRPGATGIGFDAYVVPNQPTITLSKKSNVRIGDKIVLPGTAITDANYATVIAIATGIRKDGQPIAIATLDIPVTGVTTAPDTQGLICIGAVATPLPVANITFSTTCGCVLVQEVSNTLTSSSKFPPGMPWEGSDCGQTQYCWATHDFTVGSNNPDEYGTLIL
jgi:hypothetical protein